MSRITRVEVHEFDFEAANLARDGVAIAVDHELGGTALAVRRVLGYVRDTPVRRDEDIAGIGQQFTEQQRDEGRLAAAVVTDQPDMLAGGDLDGCIGDARLRGCTRLPARSTQRGGGRWRSW